MDATDFFTRRILGMDYRVWGAMLLVCIVSLGLFGYERTRLTSKYDQPCPADTITINGKRLEVVAACYLNRYSLFELQTDPGATVEWDFRDGTMPAKGQIVSHQFIEEGSYRVTARVNGTCEFDIGVEVIKDPLLARNLEKPVVEVFADPMRPKIGNTVKFYCVADLPLVTSYEWKVLNTKEVKKDEVASFTFKNEGNYTIQVMVNNDPSTITSRVIVVDVETPQTQGTALSGSAGGMPADIGPLGNLITPGGNLPNAAGKSNEGLATNHAGTPGPAVDTSKKASMPKAPEVDPNAFRDLLQNVVDQNGKEPDDLYQYLDYKESTMVEVNGNKTLVPLKEFCKKMRDKKKNKRKIESLSFTMDDKKSIQAIRVKVAESGRFWDWVNPFN